MLARRGHLDHERFEEGLQSGEGVESLWTAHHTSTSKVKRETIRLTKSTELSRVSFAHFT